jgi:dolichol-phosphate mannosyltransferase
MNRETVVNSPPEEAVSPAAGELIEAPQVCVVLPTYNEADNLPAMVAALLALPIPGLQVVVVDDDSPDGTGRVADRLAKHQPGRVRVLHRVGKRGLGRAYVEGFQEALRLGASYIVQMDADFSHNPEDVIRLLEAVEEADVAVGSRYIPGGELDADWSWWRRFLSWWANAVYTQTLLGLTVQDATAGFKCWRRATLEAIALDRIRSNGYVFQVEMAYVTEHMGFHTVEIPIYFEDRRVGRSKMTLPVKVEAAWRVLEIRWRYRNLRREPALSPQLARPAQGTEPS